MKRFLLAAMLMFLLKNISAQGIYAVDEIPAELIKNASVVIRNQEQEYDIKNPGSAVYNYKNAVTILNKNGETASGMHEFYDKFSRVYNLRAVLFDAKGDKIKEFKNADFKDVSAVSSGSLYEDNRVKYLEVLNTTYPYTIEYSYSVDYNGIRFYPTWNPVSSWGYSIEKSSYTFKIPQSMSFKYLKSKGLKTDSLKVKDKIEYKWSCGSVPALEYEPLSAGLRNVTPWVVTAPNQFEYDNSKANIESWKSLGSWLLGLSDGMQVLPESTKEKIHSLVKDAKTPKEKIQLLYSYLQANTRYVGVQLGIGGYKPIAAEKVAAVNYGDCKALSNYMKAMLQEVGIPSNLVVIGNDMPSLNPDFTSLNQANHMILCIPMEKDTTWLECTSQHVPAGYIGNGNSDKTVLLITEDGGKLAQTPNYTPAKNYQIRKTRVKLNEDGMAEVNIETKYGCAQYEQNLGMMFIEPAEQRKRLINSLSIPNAEIGSYHYIQPDKEAAVLEEKIDLKASQLLNKGGDRLFITLNLINRQEGVVTPVDDRKTYFGIEYGYYDDDQITYTIPKGYKVEFIPKDVTIESEFGKYTASTTLKDNTIIYNRSKMMIKKQYPPEKYNDYAAFYKKIYQADKQKGILTKIE